MNWLKVLGWFLFILPLLSLFGFSTWMIMGIMHDDDNVKAFVMIMIATWVIGLVLLLLTYFSDLAIVAGFS